MNEQELRAKLAELKTERDQARLDSLPATELELDYEIEKVKTLLINL